MTILLTSPRRKRTGIPRITSWISSFHDSAYLEELPHLSRGRCLQRRLALSGSSGALLPLHPLRTARESFPSSRSSYLQGVLVNLLVAV